MSERKGALSKKYRKLKEILTDRARELKPLVVGDVVYAQNQQGKSPLRWIKSGTVVYSMYYTECSVNLVFFFKWCVWY